MFFNLGAQAASAVLLLSSTILFALKGLPGLAWQLAAGTGIFVPYLVMQTPIFERLLAVAQSEGTLSFLIFLSDGIGYVVSITLLLYRDFAPATAVAGGELALFERMAGGCAARARAHRGLRALPRGAIGRAKRSSEDAEAGGGGGELRAAIRTCAVLAVTHTASESQKFSLSSLASPQAQPATLPPLPTPPSPRQTTVRRPPGGGGEGLAFAGLAAAAAMARAMAVERWAVAEVTVEAWKKRICLRM